MAEDIAPGRNRRWRLRLLLAGISLVFAVIVAEAALRLAGFSYVTFERTDPVRGVTLAPGARGWQTLEGRTYVEINSHGYHDRERSRAKPAGVYRVAVVGDSFVEARQVGPDQSFCAVLERLLNERSAAFGGRTVEVLNFGVSGYGTAQQLLTLREDVFDFDPDRVLLAFFPGNDVADNSKAISHPSHTVPYFTLRGDELVADTSFRRSRAYLDRSTTLARAFFAAQRRSRVLQLLYRAKGDLTEVIREGGVQPSPFGEPGLPNQVYAEPRTAEWQEAWRVTERLIGEVFNEVTGRGRPFGLVTVSTPIQVNPDRALRRRFTDQLRVADLFYPDRRIKRLGDRLGFPVLNLGELLQQYVDEHQLYLHGFENTRMGWGHWNEEGHALAARVIADWMVRGHGPDATDIGARTARADAAAAAAQEGDR